MKNLIRACLQSRFCSENCTFEPRRGGRRKRRGGVAVATSSTFFEPNEVADQKCDLQPKWTLKTRPRSEFFYLAAPLLLLSACEGVNIPATPNPADLPKTEPVAEIDGQPDTNPLPKTSPSEPIPTPKITPPENPKRSFHTDVLLFAGAGTWAVEVASLENILSKNGATYLKVTSAQLDTMSIDDIEKYGILLFPGGSGGTQAGSLSADTHARLREAVQKRRVSYLGFCAGAFIAVAPAPKPGQDVSYGLGILNGEILDYYYLEHQGVSTAMTQERFADGSQRDLVWYGGPVTPEIQGGVVARYPDRSPAITQAWSDTGFVVLSGPHPAAPQSFREEQGLRDADGVDFELTWRLVKAALDQRPMATF